MTDTIISDNTTGTYIGDYPGTEDTVIRADFATTNYATDTVIKATKYNSSIHAHSLLKFSGISNIPSSDTVSAATQHLYVASTNVPASTTASLRRLLRDWVENQATWNIWSTGNSWTTAGGLSSGNDRSGTVTGTFLIDSTGYKSITGSQLVSDAQNEVSGAVPIRGHHVERTDAGEDLKFTDIRSSEGTDGQRPALALTHAAGGGATIPVFINHYRNQGIM